MVYMFLADGFEEIEAITPLDILRRADISVTTVALTPEFRAVVGAHGVGMLADAHFSEVEIFDTEMIILPGGAVGTDNLNASEWVKSCIRAAADSGAYIAAICAAPSILGSMNLLGGVCATCFPGYEQELVGAVISDKSVAADGRMITAKAAGAAAEFGFALVAALKDAQTAAEIREKMFYV